MEHIFYPAENAKGTLILLHGTGGMNIVSILLRESYPTT